MFKIFTSCREAGAASFWLELEQYNDAAPAQSFMFKIF
jgi:hypothetical protein